MAMVALSLSMMLMSGCNAEEIVPKGEVAAKELVEEVSAQADNIPKQEEMVLKVVGLFEEGTPMYTLYEEILRDFEEKHEGVSVQGISRKEDDQWKANILLDFMVGNSPDILYFPTGNQAKGIVNSNQVVTINEIRTQYPSYGNHLLERAIENAAYPFNQKSYALPLKGSYYGVFYNENLLSEQDINIPTNIISFETAIDALLEQGITPLAIPLQANPEPFLDHLFLAYNGRKPRRADTLKDNQEEWLIVLKKVAELYEKGAFMQGALSESEESMKQAFIHQQAAIYIGEESILPSILEMQSTSIFPMPSIDEEKSLLVYFDKGYYLTRSAFEDEDKREISITLITNLTNQEVAKEAMRSSGRGVAATEIESLEGLTSLSALGTILAKETPNWEIPVGEFIKEEGWNYLKAHLSYMLEGIISPEELLDQSIARER